MAIIATPGDPDANSYVTVDECTAYNANREGLDGTSVWSGADPLAQESALMLATSLLDSMPEAWTGAAATPTQGLRWPRLAMTNRDGFSIDHSAIPRDLKNATCEFARRLLDEDTTGNNDVKNDRIKLVKAGSVEVEYDQLQPEAAAGSVVVANKSADLAGHSMVPDVVRVMLVPSWLLPTVNQTLMTNKTKFVFTSLAPQGE